MFDKRLFDLVPKCKLYILGIVIFKWLALLCNFAIMSVIASWMAYYFVDGAPKLMGTSWNILIIAAAIQMISIYLSQVISAKLSRKAKATIRQEVYDKLLDLGPSYEEKVSASEAMQTSIDGANQLEVYFGGFLPQLFYSLVAPITLFALLISQAGLAAAVLMLLVPLIPVSIVFIQKPARAAAKKYWGSYVDLGGDFLEAVQGLTTLKIYQADEAWHNKMNTEAEGFRKATMDMLVVQLRSIVIMDLFAYCGAATGIVIAVSQFASGTIGFEAAFLIVFLSQEFFLPMRALGSLFHAGMGGMAASKKMYEILDASPRKSGSIQIDKVDEPANIVLENVGYMYEDRAAISNINLEISSPGMCAFVGESGSGKSTISNILAAQKLNYTGKVSLCGVDYADITTPSLMRAVTLVSSNAHLFKGTIKSNLMMANIHATDKELWEALTKARVDGFVRAAGGLDFELEESGGNVSGGQAQRIALARALLRDTKVYIFDEATSSIDSASEEAISAVMHDLAKTHTVIVVAHRLALVENADKIVVLNQGRIAEVGTHTQLLENGREYKRLWEAQASLAEFANEKGYGEAARIEDRILADKVIENQEYKAEYKPHVSSFKVISRLIGLVSPLLPYLILAIFLGVIGHLAAIFLVSYGAYGLVAAAGAPLGVTLKQALIMAVACGVVRGPARYGEQLSNHYIAFRLLAHIRDLIFSALRKLAPAKLEGKGKGDVISLVTSDVELLEVFYAHTISPIAIAIVVTICMYVYINSYSHTLATIALIGYIAVGVILPKLASLGLRGKGAEVRSETGSINAYVLDQLRGISQTMQYGQEGVASDVLSQKTSKVGVSEVVLKRRGAVGEGLVTLVILFFDLMMLLFAFDQVYSGVMDANVAFVLTFTYLSSFGPTIAVCRLGTSLQQTIGAGERVLDLLDEKAQVNEVVDGKDIVFSGAELKGVSFNYDVDDTKKNVLDNINIELEDGSITCITGASGSGKSTILKLLMRFWDVDEGEVLISGVNVKDINTKSLREAQGYMTQDTYLFEGTIKDNICIANPNATPQQISAAVKSASLDNFIARLPYGLDTQVGDLGGALSGGEKQRIGLARIFLHNAPLVLLDEPTSNLDALSEAAVMKSIAQSRSGKTIVLVSHRASTAAFADNYINVNQGRIS